MEVPYDDGGILFKRNPVSRGDASESGNALTVQTAGIFVKRIIIEVIKETCHKCKRKVSKLFYDLAIPFGIFNQEQ